MRRQYTRTDLGRSSEDGFDARQLVGRPAEEAEGGTPRRPGFPRMFGGDALIFAGFVRFWRGHGEVGIRTENGKGGKRRGLVTRWHCMSTLAQRYPHRFSFLHTHSTDG